jgi:hypothetical protein
VRLHDRIWQQTGLECEQLLLINGNYIFCPNGKNANGWIFLPNEHNNLAIRQAQGEKWGKFGQAAYFD